MSKELKKSWEKRWEEFSKTVSGDFISPGYIANDEIKDFIQSEREQAVKEERERILKALPQEAPNGSVSEYYSGFNACLAEVKESLKNIKEKYL